VRGTNIILPIPEKQAWARANLAVAGACLYGDDTSERLINKALKLDPRQPEAYFLRAKLNGSGPVRAEALDAAVKDLDQAIALDGRDPKYFALRANLRSRPYHPFWEQALSDYTRAHELDPFNQCWLMKRAGVYEQLGNDEGAINDYSIVFDLQHSIVTWRARDAIQARARCFQRIGEFRKAIQDWNRLIKFEKWSEYFQNRALCFRKLGDNIRAEKDDRMFQRLNKKELEEEEEVERD
jgi:tetratricopeptide (TPR) repeat protein